MIYTGKLLRAEIYDDHTKPYTNVKAVYEAHKGKYPGKLIVTNGHWYNTKSVTPCGNYKVNGTVISTEEWMDWGFCWDAGQIPVMVSTMDDKDNYLSTLPLLVGGKKRDDVIKQQKSNVTLSTLRTWFGVDAAGRWTVEVTTSGYTLDGIVERMQSLGIVDGMVLDGSGSSQCYDGKTYQKGNGRDIYSYLLLWFAEDGTDDKEDDTTATYKKGIDVSEWQGTIDWDKVKAAGIEFAMIKAGSGRNRVDPEFKRNISECNRLGIPCGVYWFSYAYTEELAHNEAKYCLEAIAPYKLDYPVAFDFEYDSVNNAAKLGIEITREMASSFARAFLEDIEAARYYAMLYTNSDYLKRYFDQDLAKRYDVWLAMWQANPNLNDKPTQAGGIWQYSDTGNVPGISARVDLDAAYYDYPGIISANGLNQPSGQEPELPEAERARQWAIAAGITDGENPDSPVTRGQVWTMLYRMNGGEKK